jgi:hypothetical protein
VAAGARNSRRSGVVEGTSLSNKASTPFAIYKDESLHQLHVRIITSNGKYVPPVV